MFGKQFSLKQRVRLNFLLLFEKKKPKKRNDHLHFKRMFKDNAF